MRNECDGNGRASFKWTRCVPYRYNRVESSCLPWYFKGALHYLLSFLFLLNQKFSLRWLTSYTWSFSFWTLGSPPRREKIRSVLLKTYCLYSSFTGRHFSLNLAVSIFLAVLAILNMIITDWARWLSSKNTFAWKLLIVYWNKGDSARSSASSDRLNSLRCAIRKVL